MNNPHSILSSSEIFAIYTIHRSYAEHENCLIDHLTSWAITIQSFVIATFGFSFQKKYEIAEKLVSNAENLAKMQREILEFDIFLLFLALVGFFTAISTLHSVHAATRSIFSVENHWNTNFRFVNEYARMLPPIVGGGHPDTGKQGQWLSWSLPVFFMAFLGSCWALYSSVSTGLSRYVGRQGWFAAAVAAIDPTIYRGSTWDHKLTAR